MARDILPTPILEGKDVIEFYNKLANFKKSFEEKGITREVIREDAKLLKSIFKERPDVEKKQIRGFIFLSTQRELPYQKELLATTFIVEDEERTLGYYSVLNDSLQLKEEDFPSKSKYKKFLSHLIPHPKRHLKSVPAVKIGRLAIDKTYKGKGLGRIFIRNISDDCIELNKKIACRLITVDAYKEALPFYQRFGFEFLTEKDEQEDIRQMFLDLTNLND